VLLLEKGQIIGDGPPAEVIAQYKSSASNNGATAFLGVPASREWPDLATAPGDDVVKLRSVRICDESGATAAMVDIRRPIGIEIGFDVLKPGFVLVPGVTFFNETRQHIFDVIEVKSEWRGKPRQVGHYFSTAWIPGNLLAEGNFILH